MHSRIRLILHEKRINLITMIYMSQSILLNCFPVALVPLDKLSINSVVLWIFLLLFIFCLFAFASPHDIYGF